MESATAALGRPHRVDGVVVRGHRRGRQMGYPTANVESPPYTAIPADGVYAGHFVLRDVEGASGARFPAAISVGTNPTFDGTRRTVEAHLIDWDGDLYGEHSGVEFAARLRGHAALLRAWRSWSRDGQGPRRGPRVLAVTGCGRPCSRRAPSPGGRGDAGAW